MPELPEVELARRTLARTLEGGRITAVRSEDRIVAPGAPKALEALVGARGERVERRGKQLRIVLDGLDGGLLVFAHLGMTGEWHQAKTTDPPPCGPLALRWSSETCSNRPMSFGSSAAVGEFTSACPCLPGTWRRA